MSAELAKNQTLVGSLQGAIAATPDMTNSAFAEWYDESGTAEAFPGGIGFAYIVEVPADDVDTFGATMLADPVAGLPVPPTYEVFPAPEANVPLCLQRLGIWRTDTVDGFAVPLAFNFCARDIPGVGASDLPELLAQAASQDAPSVASPRSMGGDWFALFAPVDTTGQQSSTTGGPSGGWVASSFSASSLLSSALANDDRLAARVVYEAPGGDLETIASGGNQSEDLTASIWLPLDPTGSWQINVTGTPAAAGSSPFTQGVLVLLGGTVVSVLLFLVIRHLGSSRERALTLVDRKTAELAYQALHDPLTNLPNRTLLLDRATQLLARAHGDATPIAALFIDVDHFKTVNDTLGHGAGDQLLRAVAGRITSAVRESDTVGRLGGDEFVVLIDGDVLRAGADLAAQRILDVLAEPFDLDGTLTPITVSIGIATGERDSAEDLLRDADVALYEAKEAGRNRFVSFDPAMSDALVDRAALEWELHEALTQDQLFLQYQPTFDLHTGITTGVEALVRWRHPTRGVVPPDDFIPLAESRGLIVPIGTWVLQQACQQGAMWDSLGRPTRVAVNVSARQLAEPDFVDIVRGALDTTGFEPQLLVLELTETALMQDAFSVRDCLNELKAIGARIAIDDFGTGYSSMAYLQKFPVDSIKIDRAFIHNLAESPESTALVRTLVQLGKSLGLETLAEGIEDQNQMDELLHEHCDSGQGFLYSRPLDADAATAFLQHQPVVAPGSQAATPA